MRRDEALMILAEHREEIEAFGVRRLAVFGSVARDEAGPEFLESIFGLNVDLVTEEGVKRQLRERIFGEAVDVA